MIVLDLLVGLILGARFSGPRGSLWSEGLGLQTFVGAMSTYSICEGREMIYAMDTYEFFKRERREKSTKYVKTKVELDTEIELLMVLCISSN